MKKPTQSDIALRQLENQYFGKDMHEGREIRRLPSILDGVSSFVDIGSSLGQYAYFAGKILRNADIYCIEPDPFKAKRLRVMTAEWARYSDNRYHVIEKALGDEKGMLPFFYPKDHLSSGAFFPLSGNFEEWEEVPVETDTLDNIFGGRPVDFLKIDVEGAEYRVLCGARQLLQLSGIRLLLEIAPWGDLSRERTPSDVLALLERYGYTFSIFENHYLFYKGGMPIMFRIKNRIMRRILDNPSLKSHAKRTFEFLRAFHR